MVWSLNFAAFQLFLTRAPADRSDTGSRRGIPLRLRQPPGGERHPSPAHPDVLSRLRPLRPVQSPRARRPGRRGTIAPAPVDRRLLSWPWCSSSTAPSIRSSSLSSSAPWPPSSRGSLVRRARRLLSLARAEAPVLLGSGLLAAALVAPLVERYLIAAKTVGLRSWVGIEPLLPRWQSWLLMGHDNWLYGWVYGTKLWPVADFWRSSAHANGIGLVATACAIAGLWHEPAPSLDPHPGRARGAPGAPDDALARRHHPVAVGP